MSKYDNKKANQSFTELERHLGRVLSHMSIPRMLPFHTAMKSPPIDMVETDLEIIIYMEIPGVNPEEISVVADEQTVTISGERKPPIFPDTTCIHHLEIEHGRFKKIISLPTTVNIGATTSRCKQGYLMVKLPKLQQASRIKITVE